MGSGVVLAALFGVASTVVACSSSARAPANAGSTSAAEPLQLIVKFRDVSDPSDPAFLERLATSIGAPVSYVRPLSGGFHVLRVYPRPGSIDVLLERFKSLREVSQVEPDLPVRRQ